MLLQMRNKIEYLLNFDGKEDYSTVVVEFPCDSGETLIAENVDAVTQLELVKRLQTVWSDNSVSVTVYYKPEELRKELLVQFKIDIKSVNSIESIIRESEFIFKTYSNYFINGSKLALLVFKDRYNTIYIGKKIEIKVYSGKKCLHTEENNLNIHDIEPISRTQLPLIKKPINNLDLLDGESIIV